MASPITYTSANTTYRLIFNLAADWTALYARSRDANGWYPFYYDPTDPVNRKTIRGYAMYMTGLSSASACDDPYTLYQRFLAMIATSAVDYPYFGDGVKSALLNHAIWVATNINPASYTGSSHNDERRNYCLALAYAFEFLYNETLANFSGANRKLIGERINDWCDVMNASATETMQGYTRDDQSAQVVGSLALLGRSGSGYDFTAGAEDAGTRFEEAMGFFYGGGFATDGKASLDTDRYFWASGGGFKGTGYTYRDTHWIWRALHALKYSLTGLKLGGESYDPFDASGADSWTQQCWKHFVHHSLRGDRDYWTHGDCYRTTNPYFGIDQRGALGFLVRDTADTSAKKYLTWAWKKAHEEEVARGYHTGYGMAEQFLMFDISPPIQTPTTMVCFSDPPGLTTVRDHWNLETSTIYQLRTKGRYLYGHDCLERGSLSCSYYEDVVLAGSGLYRTQDVLAAYGGTHSIKWRHQSIGQSGIVLVDDSTSLPHRAYCDENLDGVNEKAWVPSGLGGQYFKTNGVDDPDLPLYIDTLRLDGSGETWKCCEGTDTTKSASLLDDNAEVCVVYSSLRKAYLKLYTDIDTAAERTRRYDAKWMFIKTAWTHPMCLLVHRVESRLAAMPKRMEFHFFNTPTSSSLVSTKRIQGWSYGRTRRKNPTLWGTTEFGCNIDLYAPGVSYRSSKKIGDWDISIVGGGTTNYSTPGPYDYYYGGTNYTFTAGSANDRHYPDLGRARAEVRPSGTDQVEDYYVALIYPIRSDMTPPTYTWIDESNYFGIEINGKAYKLHKTLAEFVDPTDPVDVVPPGIPTGLAGTTPASQTAVLTCNLNTEHDINKYFWYKRVKV